MQLLLPKVGSRGVVAPPLQKLTDTNVFVVVFAVVV